MKKYFILLTLCLLSFSLFFLSCNSSSKKNNLKKEVIKIGAVLPLTGKYSDAGTSVKLGLYYAIDDLNKKSKSCKYDLYLEDSQSEPSKVLNGYRKLTSVDGVKILFTTTTSHVFPIKELALKDSILLFGIASHPDVTKDNNGLIFRPNNTAIEECQTISDFVKEGKDVKNIVIFYFNSEFGLSFTESIKKYLKDRNIKTIPYDDSMIDFRNILPSDVTRNIVSNVVVIGFTPSMGKMIKTIRELGYNGQILTNTGFNNPSIIEAGGEASQGVFYVESSFPFSEFMKIDSMAVNSFKTHFSSLSFMSYFSVKLINLAIESGVHSNVDIGKFICKLDSINIDNIEYLSHKDGSLTPKLYMNQFNK